MNWGKGIFIALSIFIVFIVTLVVIMFRQNVELETEDYYLQEIAYQDEITALNNAQALAELPEIKLNDQHLTVQLPGEAEYTNVVLNLLRPDDKSKDQEISITNTRTFLIDNKDLSQGKYLIKLSYEVDGKPCLQKDEIYIK